MNTVQRIAKNVSVLLLSRIISYILNFFFIVYAARYLGAEGFGVLSFGLAFTAMFAVISDLGLSILTVRDVSKDKSLASKYLANIIAMKIILALIMFLSIWLSINLLGYPEQTKKIVYIVALGVVSNAFRQAFFSIFQAFEKMEYQAFGLVLGSVFQLAAGLFVISRGYDIIAFAVIYFAANTISLIYAFVICARKILWPKIGFQFAFWKFATKCAWVFAVGNFFASLYFMIDRVMLSTIKGDVVVGQYSAAYNLINALSVIPLTFAVSVFPVMSSYSKISKDALNKIYFYSVKCMFTLALPITICTILLSKRIIYMIYGNEFAASAQALNILIWAEMLIFISTIMSYMLISINKQKITLINVIVGTALNIGLNFLLIPRISYSGAAISTVVSGVYCLVASVYFLKKYGYSLNFSKIIKVPLIASMLVGGVVYYLGQTTFLILIPTSVILYFAILYTTKYISDKDMVLLKQVLRIKQTDGN